MTLFLKPAEGRTVDQEDGSPWPAGGMEVEPTLYVRRRIADLDLVPADPEPAPAPAPAPAETLPPAPVADQPAAPLRKRGKKTAGEA